MATPDYRDGIARLSKKRHAADVSRSPSPSLSKGPTQVVYNAEAPSLCRLENLPGDIFEIIYTELSNDPQTLRSICLVCRSLYSSAGKFVYQSLTLRIGLEFSTVPRIPRKQHQAARREPLKATESPPAYSVRLNHIYHTLHNPSLASAFSHIRSITIRGVDQLYLTVRKHLDDSRLEQQWALVAEVVAAARNLRRFCYNVDLPFPPFLLEKLEKEHPNVKLEVLTWYRRCDRNAPVDDPVERALARSKCLDTIALNAYGPYNSTSKVPFCRTVLSAPNLKVIRYNADTPALGARTIEPPEPEPRALIQHENCHDRAGSHLDDSHFKELVELKLRNTLIWGFPMRPLLERLCRHLEARDSLSKLSVDLRSNMNADLLCTFLNSCRLQALAIFDPVIPVDYFGRDSVVTTILEGQTQTLQFLMLDWTPFCAQLQCLRESCSHLTFLAIRASPLAFLPFVESSVSEEVRKFSRLECLRLSFIDRPGQRDVRVWWKNATDSHLRGLVRNTTPRSAISGITLKKLAIAVSPHITPDYGSGRSNRVMTHAVFTVDALDSDELRFHHGYDLVGFWEAKAHSFPSKADGYPMRKVDWRDMIY